MKKLYSISLTQEEVMELHHRLLYKVNPLWVSLRGKLEDCGICVHCGGPFKKKKEAKI